MIPVGLIQPQIFPDDRGHFQEMVNMSKEPFSSELFIQQNVSYNKKYVFRGMHYQYKNPQAKLVTVLKGSVTDFIVDLREWSPNFGKVQSYQLSEKNRLSLWVPQCFAHGFLCLEDDTIFSYNVFDNPRVVGDEYSINPFSLGMEFGEFTIMSDKDRNGMSFKDAPKYE